MKRTFVAASVLLIFTICLVVSDGTALASSFGVVGWSGANGGDCSTCHTGGAGSTTPIVVVDGNATVAPSGTVSYLLSITSTTPMTQTIAGWNIAVVDSSNQITGTLSGFDVTTARLETGELTHLMPQMNDANGVVQVAFDWNAPDTLGTYTIYVAANSANNDGSNGEGDATGLTTFEVTVAEQLEVGLAQVSAETYSPLWLLPALLLFSIITVAIRYRSARQLQ